MTLEWLFAVVVAGLMVERVVIRILGYLQSENTEERLRCEASEHERIYRNGWNCCFRAMEIDQQNYSPKYLKKGETGEPVPQQPWEKEPEK